MLPVYKAINSSVVNQTPIHAIISNIKYLIQSDSERCVDQFGTMNCDVIMVRVQKALFTNDVGKQSSQGALEGRINN